MIRMVLVAGAIALLSACSLGANGGVHVGFNPAAATERIEQLETRYLAVKGSIDFVADFLPAEIATKVRAAQATFERAIAMAKIATTTADQVRALRQAEAAIDVLAAPS